jgi:hypothetical protein
MRLTVFGCSFGDYLQGGVARVYGERLALLLGRDYQHESRGGSSCRRLWRRYWELTQAGQLADSINIVQYTEPTRTEFWAARPPYSSWQTPSAPGQPPAFNEEPHSGGTILRYKLGSDQWQNTGQDQRFFSMYEQGYVSAEWARHEWSWQHDYFQQWITALGHRTIFLRSRIHPEYPLLDHLERASFRDPWQELTAEQYRYEPEDTCHMNDLGHSELAGRLADHIRSLGWG